jgi:regulator of RNase E activity RraA
VQVPLSIEPISSHSPSSSDSSFPATEVHPFDIVIADLDGVVVVRPDYVDRVIELARKGREIDERCRRDLEEGKGVKETFKRHRGK